MKKSMLLLLVLVLTCIVNAHDLEQYRETCREINLPNSGNWSYQPTRPVPNWTFSCTPVSLLFSYYDYMIGSYNDCPLYAEPDPQYGGYFMTFHAKRTPTGQRRVYQCYVDENGVLEPQSEQPIVNNWEGYPTLAVDPVSGKPLYAWHANVDADAEYEVQFAYDRFLSGFTGIMSTPSIVFDNPSIVMPYNTTNNEFIWPSLQIGPSPTAGMRRAYVLARNAETNTVNPSENVKIAYADFNGDMLEMGSFLTWSYISIPLLDIWNHDTVTWRRPYLAFTVGNDGNIYCIGYHDARVIATDLPVNEPDLDVFVCPNYGQGTWTRYTAYSKTPTWNPPTNFGTGPGYFKNANNVPYTNEQIYWKIINSNHFNAVYNNSGYLHFTGLWAFQNVDNLYYSQMNVIKEVRFNVNTQQFTINEVYPKSGLSSDNILWQPWDINGDNLVDTFNTSTGDPVIITDWNYPHWNDAAHSNAMTFHYNNFKVTKPNANGWMACVWQNSWRAKQYNQYQNTAYSQYANVPEIFISVSSNYGQDWSEPMVINSVQIQQFNNIKPMWVYPADIIKNTGTIVNGHPVGKLALMFYDDISWGAYSIDSPQGTNSGGYVKYMTINIEMPAGSTSGITGYVRRADNQQPIANATVACGDQTTLTNAQGMYTLNVLPGLCTVNAVAPGYIPTTANVTVTEGNFTNHNFNLTAYPLVSVYGVVQGGNPAQPLTNATVTLTGVQNYSAVTNTVGEFNIPNVISNYSYDYTISKPGYWNALGSIVVISSNHNMGTIQLVEILASPLNVLATELPGNQQVHLQWVAPVPSRWSSDSAQKPMFTNERTDRSLTGYTIWRMLEGQELNQAVWVLIGSCNAGSTTITDTNWGALNEGNYKYAVRANYGNDSSEPTFSNILHRYLYGTLTGYVRDLDDLPVCNALVSLYRVVPDGNGPYFGNTNSLGQYSIPGIMYGLYALSFEALCYCPVDNLEITIFQNLVTTYDVVLQDLLIPPCIATAEVNTQNTLVLVHWEMPELDNNRSLTGFRIWRFCGDNDDNPDAWTFLAETIVTFNYIDLGWSALPAGIYKYAIRAIYSGNHQSEAALSNPVEKTTGLSPENAVAGIDYLYGASPNPFRGKTSITYSLMQNQPVNIEIYSITGQLISKISKSDSKSGLNTLSWNACDKAGKPLPSGVYICRMITNGTTYSRKLILLR